MTNVYLFATAQPAGQATDLFSMLGIDGWTLLFQVIAFLILVFALGKWVYPIFINMIDKREAELAAGAKAAEEAKKAADSANAETAQLLAEARREAGEIVAIAKTEAASMVEAAQSKAKSKAEAIVAAARDDINKDIAAARDTLHNEMIDLVTAATEKVVGIEVSKHVDQQMIATAVKEGVK